MELYLHNSLSRKKELFEPLDSNHVRMYVCGPTVYNLPHIGNARAVVVYDVLYRVLKMLYPKVTYVRNITDVDDKIIKASQETGEPITELTARITKGFHSNMAALSNLEPDIEPKATEHIPHIITMIEQLIANGNAYETDGHVLFSVKSAESYGKLSGKKLEDLIAGARVNVEDYKADSGDFVLWKPDSDKNSSFDSPWGPGRPGWHIECSAMSTEYLGQDFDIHGGGADLKFPHHENEIAQSTCANPGSHFAKYWIHNGFLTVNGEKMAKSEGNFITVQELLDKGVAGEVIRYVLLATKYNEPLDWSEKRVDDAKKFLDSFYRKISSKKELATDSSQLIAPLCDDLNTPEFFAQLHSHDNDDEAIAALQFLGLLKQDPEIWFKAGANIDENEIISLIDARNKARDNKDFAESDRIRDALKAKGVILEDGPKGTTWRKT